MCWNELCCALLWAVLGVHIASHLMSGSGETLHHCVYALKQVGVKWVSSLTKSPAPMIAKTVFFVCHARTIIGLVGK